MYCRFELFALRYDHASFLVYIDWKRIPDHLFIFPSFFHPFCMHDVYHSSLFNSVITIPMRVLHATINSSKKHPSERFIQTLK